MLVTLFFRMEFAVKLLCLILILCVERLTSRLSEPGFAEYVMLFDMYCMVETFTSENFDFTVYFDDFLSFHCPVEKLSHHDRRSGCVVVSVKKSLN